MYSQRTPFAGRLGPRTVIVLDALLAAVLAFAVGANLLAGAWSPSPGVPRGFAVVVVLVAVAPIVVRRVWPVGAYAAGLALWVVTLAVGAGWEGFAVALPVLYTVAAAVRPEVSLGALGCGVVLLCFVPDEFGQVVLGALALGTAWLLGWLTRDRRATAAVVLRQREAEAVTAERLRIAREIHDIVSHSLTLIAVKASVATHVAASRPAEAGDALTAIESTSRAALADLRRMLGMLRDSADAPTAPAPSVSGLAELARNAELGGVRVRLVVSGVADLPDGVGQSVYRIVQEALTNVVRHAAPASCSVVVGADGTAVTIEVTDDGRATPGVPGHGLIGMRERVALFDGEFTAGPRPDGGFAVRARLPYAEVPA